MTKQSVLILFANGMEGGNLKQSKKTCFQEEEGLYLDYAENYPSHSSFYSLLLQGFNELVALNLASI